MIPRSRFYYVWLRLTGAGHYEARALVWRRYVKPLILEKAKAYPQETSRAA